nr:SAM-dependent methyltransferase TehB [uncultured Moellerella sp.]
MQLNGGDMSDLVCYKTMPVWDKESIPLMFKERHNTQEGTYAQLQIIQGGLDFILFAEDGSEQLFHFDINNQPPILEPQVWHRIATTTDDVKCQLSFLCQPELKFYKQYGLSAPHSEVRFMADEQIIHPCSVLDLGSGRGRNSFFLAQQGYDVTAVDINQQHIDAIESVKKDAGIDNIKTAIYDINSRQITEHYDLIISTVVLMFLKRENIAGIVKNMQQQTNVDGINLIVCPVETENMPYDQLPFNCFLKPDELKSYYQDWEIIKYNENPGHLHKIDAQGNRIKLNFATIIAKKRA